MNCSFTPAADWFVFDETTGATLNRGFKSKTLACAWITQQRLKVRA